MVATGGNWRRWLRVDVALTCVALGTGIAGALLAGRFLSARASAAEAEVARRYEAQEVVVASADVKRGAALDGGNLALRKMPRAFLPADAIPASRAADALGGRAVIDIARGTPIVSAAIATDVSAPRLSSVLAEGERAVTVSVDDLSSQAGSLREGDRVDLYLSRREAGEALLVPLLQQVEVLAVGDSFLLEEEGGPRHFSTVTLRVSAGQAPRILLAQQAGELSTLLRNHVDQGVEPEVIRNGRELLRSATPRTVAQRVEVLTGGSGRLVPDRTWLATGTRTAGDLP